VNTQLDQLPANSDLRLKMLLSKLLSKKPAQRPSIFDIMSIDFIRDKVFEFKNKYDIPVEEISMV